ncbi:MAG TPA: Ig-like domain-containing protein [Longimicrobium sp.]|jgi:hypothetical protein
MSRLKRAATAAAILFAAACTGDAGKVLGPSEGPRATISDAAHAGQVPGFYFLPPLVPAPSFSGTFDPALSPTVVVCELSGTSCGSTVATFTTSSGLGGQVVQVSPAEELYKVNWHTNLSNLDPAKTYRISVYVGTFLLGYADVDVVSSGKELKNVDTQQYIPLVDDKTLPIKFRIETGIVGQVVVSPASATINVGQTQQFTATLIDLHGNPVTGPTVTWSSSNTAVATIDQTGLATGVSPGTVTITATSGGASGTATLTVLLPNTPPVANNDAFDAIGNFTTPVAAPGVLANDTDADAGNTLSVAAPGTYATAAGGTVTINADGSFAYLSPSGFTGSDSFTYTATDGTDSSAPATVTMTVATRVWYVSNAGAAPGDGRDASPFTTLKAAETASAAGETIFLLAGNGSTTGYQDGIVLKNGQALTGQGVAANVTASLNGQTVVLLAAGSAPTVTRTTAGTTVALASNNTVQGLHVASSNGAGIAGSAFGTFTAASVSVGVLGGPAVDLTNGTAAASFRALSSSGSGSEGVRLVSVSGSFQVTGDGATAGSGGTIQNTSVGYRVVPNGSSTLTVDVRRSVLRDIATNGVFVAAAAAGSSGTTTLVFKHNQVTSTVSGKGGSVLVLGQQSTTTVVDVTDNTFSNVSGNGLVNVDARDASTIRGTIARNSISNAGAAGMVVSVEAGGAAQVVIDDNDITSVGSDGIQAANFGGAGTSSLDLVLTNNTVNGHNQNPSNAFVAGIAVFRFEDDVCLAMTGNTVTGTPAGFFDAYLDGNFGGDGGAITYESSGSGPLTDAELVADNSGLTQANVFVSSVNKSNGATCARP